jgi:hypothetical protein
MVDRRREVFGTIEEAAPKHEYAVGARAHRIATIGRRALVVRRKQEILAAIGSGQTD